MRRKSPCAQRRVALRLPTSDFRPSISNLPSPIFPSSISAFQLSKFQLFPENPLDSPLHQASIPSMNLNPAPEPRPTAD